MSQLVYVGWVAGGWGGKVEKRVVDPYVYHVTCDMLKKDDSLDMR